MRTETHIATKSDIFVQHTITQCQQDKGFSAILRRAGDPATEYQCWEHLVAFQIDLDNDYLRLPYATIAAAIAKAKVRHNGTTGIGRAIAQCYEDGHNSYQAKTKLRRLLASENVEEICRILPPVFSLIDTKANITLNYVQLLKDLLNFHHDSQWVKTRWAQDFYHRVPIEEQA